MSIPYNGDPCRVLFGYKLRVQCSSDFINMFYSSEEIQQLSHHRQFTVVLKILWPEHDFTKFMVCLIIKCLVPRFSIWRFEARKVLQFSIRKPSSKTFQPRGCCPNPLALAAICVKNDAKFSKPDFYSIMKFRTKSKF